MEGTEVMPVEMRGKPERRPETPALVIVALASMRDRQYIKAVIERDHNCVVIEASTYHEILIALSRYGVSAILCDASLRWRDVLSCIATALERPRVIIATPRPDDATRSEALELGAIDVLTLPVSDADIHWLASVTTADDASLTKHALA